ncbi:alpha/beta hydrolase [Paenirhodobacter populi]|uniref:alpha/beta hydrolase n=1 Tax=Paenirhodobacter populi TaxID=2306993 RepID=UPI000FE29ECE|nr:dienelactone hydrolase family protein [Sinirhodobacter populi]RWR09471.1 phospholipase [Sinirhodobacter populi]
MADQLVIFLHGVGARGADLAGLGPLWQARLPGTVFAAPDAPFAFDQGGSGYQWFSLRGITAANRGERIVAARPAFDALIAGIIAANGFEGRLDRVALVGFSQGAIMALDALASGRWPVGAVLAYSGRLATPGPLTPATGTPALLIHGDADQAVPCAESISAEERLCAAGVRAELVVEPGHPHGISPQGALRGVAFLAQVFGVSGLEPKPLRA